MIWKLYLKQYLVNVINESKSGFERNILSLEILSFYLLNLQVRIIKRT